MLEGIIPSAITPHVYGVTVWKGDMALAGGQGKG